MTYPPAGQEPWTAFEIESSESTAGRKRKPEPKDVVNRRKIKQRRKEKELLKRVNAKLSPLGLDWKSLLSAIDAGTVTIKKEK